MRRVAGARRTAGRRDLFDGERIRDVVEARPPVRLRHEHAERPELAESVHQVDSEVAADVPRPEGDDFEPTPYSRWRNEYLAGPTTQTVTVGFYGSYGTGEVHATLYPIHKNRTVVAFKWRPDGSAAVSVTNPELRGNVQLLNYGPGAERGAVDTFDATFITGDAAGLAFFTA